MTEYQTYQPSFSAKVSHELRIPLTAIFGLAQFLNQTTLTAQQSEYVQGILDAAQRLLNLEQTLHAALQNTSI